MKKIIFYLPVLFACIFLLAATFGQNNSEDSVSTELKFVDEVVEKLNSEDAVEIAKFIEQLLHDREMAVKFADPTRLSADIMPVVVFIFVLLVLYIPFYFNFKKVKGRQLIITNLIEKGKEVPDELLSPTLKRTTRSDFHKAIILITLGLGIGIVILALKIENNYWTIGLIPIFIGIGYLISQMFDKRGDKI
ncbi:MAG: hypothetical protein JSV22_13810 [Bacteroidales bacterium]|nr:MAG: hypothetical protein JSV22_13810 [Bacteroidales bacterium]